MINHAQKIPPQHILQTQLCIVGAGAAGVTLALELAENGVEVILLEAGGWTADKYAFDDLSGEMHSQEHHAPLHECRSRQLGGTTAIWAGRCLPLDPIDLERRDYVPNSGWPIGWEVLDPYYPRANEYCHVGSYIYQSRAALGDREGLSIHGCNDGLLITDRIERWSPPTHFGKHYRRVLAASKTIHVLLNAVCTGIDLDPESRRVKTVNVASEPGRSFRVQARSYVIAGGGLESTRLLLASNDVDTEGIGNRYDLLGRYYMGHVFGSVARVQFVGDPGLAITGFERDVEGVYCRRRICISPEAQRAEGLLNTSFWTIPPPAADPTHGNGVLSAAYLAILLPVLRDRLAPAAIQRMFRGELGHIRYWPHLYNILKDIPQTTAFCVNYLYRRFFTKRRIPALFIPSATNCYDLYYHAEQSPNPESRVTLSEKKDRFGMPRLRVNLRYSAQDIDSVVRAHEILAGQLGKQGVATIKYKHEDVRGHIFDQAADGYHQLGTTRMAASDRQGVVDGQCRVHGVRNLYVCSSSVFPTSGHANPTLTIVALAVRLARHLASTAVPH